MAPTKDIQEGYDTEVAVVPCGRRGIMIRGWVRVWIPSIRRYGCGIDKVWVFRGCNCCRPGPPLSHRRLACTEQQRSDNQQRYLHPQGCFCSNSHGGINVLLNMVTESAASKQIQSPTAAALLPRLPATGRYCTALCRLPVESLARPC